jgi:hypothetical protein
MTPFEQYVTTELPQRPVMLMLANTSYDGDPNDISAPAKVASAPLGTFFIRNTGLTLWKKNSSSAGTWQRVDGGGGAGGVLSNQNRFMAALATTSDGQLATSTTLAITTSSWVIVIVNGSECHVGDGTSVGVECYFTDSTDTIIRSFGGLHVGDRLHWNGTIAGFQLETTDIIDVIYTA